jgi:hypothetical protein
MRKNVESASGGSGTLTIWFDKKDSDNFYIWEFSKDSFSGTWQWPGGGYSVTGKKINEF